MLPLEGDRWKLYKNSGYFSVALFEKLKVVKKNAIALKLQVAIGTVNMRFLLKVQREKQIKAMKCKEEPSTELVAMQTVSCTVPGTLRRERVPWDSVMFNLDVRTPAIRTVVLQYSQMLKESTWIVIWPLWNRVPSTVWNYDPSAMSYNQNKIYGQYVWTFPPIINMLWWPENERGKMLKEYSRILWN